MSDATRMSRGRLIRIVVVTIVATAAIAAGLTALLVNIIERKREATEPYQQVVQLTDETVDPAIWGRNFPLQYDLYRRTVDQVRTRYGGSEALPRVPDDADPRSVVAQSRIEEDPRLKRMWAGYAFAADFREERGHAYMLDDQLFTQRQVVAKQPGTCLHCHASVYVAYKRAGGGDLIKGFEKVNQMPYAEAAKLVDHPVSCIDCHDPETMALRVTRPGFIEGIRTVKAAQGIENYDVNTMASRQEMRAFVCGQCHVEYYFKGAEKRLTYPWEKGLRATDIVSYYETTGAEHQDWQHQISGARTLKAQHPEFELWSQGIHARSGVSCADCHMPYMRVGAMKISDHHVRSPMLNIGNACQTCHHWSEQELMERVHVIQDRTYEMRNMAIDAVLALIDDIRKAKEAGVPEPVLDAARRYQRRAQFLVDFIEAENSMGFHADQEAARVLLTSIDQSRKGQTSLRDGITTVEPFETSRGTMGPPPTAEEAQQRSAR